MWTVSSVSYHRVTREFLPTSNLMGNGLTSECSDRYSLIKGISSVTNKRHRSHGIVGFFYSCQFIKSFRALHSFWEEEDISREMNSSFTEWHHYHIMVIQFQNHPAKVQRHTLKTFMFIFIFSFSLQNLYNVFDY